MGFFVVHFAYLNGKFASSRYSKFRPSDNAIVSAREQNGASSPWYETEQSWWKCVQVVHIVDHKQPAAALWTFHPVRDCPHIGVTVAVFVGGLGPNSTGDLNEAGGEGVFGASVDPENACGKGLGLITELDGYGCFSIKA